MLLDEAVLHGQEEVAGGAVGSLHLLDEVLHAHVWHKGKGVSGGEPGGRHWVPGVTPAGTTNASSTPQNSSSLLSNSSSIPPPTPL